MSLLLLLLHDAPVVRLPRYSGEIGLLNHRAGNAGSSFCSLACAAPYKGGASRGILSAVTWPALKQIRRSPSSTSSARLRSPACSLLLVKCAAIGIVPFPRECRRQGRSAKRRSVARQCPSAADAHAATSQAIGNHHLRRSRTATNSEPEARRSLQPASTPDATSLRRLP